MDLDTLKTIGQAIGAVAVAAIGYFTGRGRRKASDAAYGADEAAYNAASKQIKSLLDRVEALERSHQRLFTEQLADKKLIAKLQIRQGQLEGLLKSHSIPVPPEV